MRHQRRNTTTPHPSLETPALFRKTVKLAYYRVTVDWKAGDRLKFTCPGYRLYDQVIRYPHAGNFLGKSGVPATRSGFGLPIQDECDRHGGLFFDGNVHQEAIPILSNCVLLLAARQPAAGKHRRKQCDRSADINGLATGCKCDWRGHQFAVE